MFDKQYYDNKFRELNERLQKKQVNFIKDVISLSSRYLDDDKQIQDEAKEITKRNEEAKKKEEIKEEPKKK